MSQELCRRTRFSMVFCVCALFGCAESGTGQGERGEPPLGQEIFDRHEITLDTTERQTVLTGHFLGRPTAEIAVLKIGEDDRRQVHFYAFRDGDWALHREVSLGAEVLFVDVATIGGRDRLITYVPGRLRVLDLKTLKQRPLVAVKSSFMPPRSNEIPHVDLTRDVNGDGREDLVVPALEGFQVLLQRRDGTFGAPLKLGPATDLSRILGADGYRYDPWSQSRVYQIDYNGDRRPDLAYWDEDRFRVHLQNKSGELASLPVAFTTEVVFGSDRMDALTVGKMTGRTLHSLTDINGDGVADLVVYSLENRGLLKKKQSSFEVHLGASRDGGLAFAREVGIRLRTPGSVQLGLEWMESARGGA